MKKFSLKLPTLCLAIFGTWFLGTQLAHAEILTSILGVEGVAVLIAQVLANIFNTLQMAAAFVLSIAGFLLNYSINLTLQMKAFLEQTPAIYITWKALRDISGLFIIFFLLYAAIKLILSIQDAKFGSLIKNIVVAGVLINFSFFFASLGIDVSNIVSIQLYNAIAPANSLNEGNLSPAGVVDHIGDGGLSDIFMKSLRIPALYDTNKSLTPAGQVAAAGGAWTAPIKIMLMGIASIIIMITATLSFAAAAFAFIIRFVVLIFLLAFSPIWFASHIVPEIGEYAKKWTGAYKGMLVFMPVYLLLMYLALNVLTTSPFLGGTDLANAAATIGTGTTVWYSSIMALVINAVIVIVLLNFPLIAAISIGGTAVKFIKTDKLGSWAVLSGARKAGGYSYQNTVARGASALARSEGLKDLASKNLVVGAALKGIRGVATPYEAKLSSQVKARTEFADSLGYNKTAVNRWESRLKNIKSQRDELKTRHDALPDTTENAAERADLRREMGDLKNDIDDTERIINEQKKVRKENYAGQINSGSPETLWTMVARKDKVAAAKIQVGIHEEQVKDKKDDLKDIKSDITELEKAIRDNPAVAGGDPAGTPTGPQQAELTRLTAKRNTTQTELNGMENTLAQHKANSEK